MTTTAHLRKAFKYPSDQDISVGETAAGLDEQEQEKLISDLKEWDRQSTLFWKTLLTATIAIINIYYVYLLFGTAAAATISNGPIATCVTCTTCSTALIYGVPEPIQARLPSLQRELDARALPPWLRRWRILWVEVAAVAVNVLFLSGVVAYAGVRIATPALVAFLIAVAGRQTLQPVDVAELERLKYGYKGA